MSLFYDDRTKDKNEWMNLLKRLCMLARLHTSCRRKAGAWRKRYPCWLGFISMVEARSGLSENGPTLTLKEGVLEWKFWEIHFAPRFDNWFLQKSIVNFGSKWVSQSFHSKIKTPSFNFKVGPFSGRPDLASPSF